MYNYITNQISNAHTHTSGQPCTQTHRKYMSNKNIRAISQTHNAQSSKRTSTHTNTHTFKHARINTYTQAEDEVQIERL